MSNDINVQMPNLPQWMKPERVFFIAIIVAFFLWLLLSTVYTVPHDGVAVVQRFGKFNKISEPGLNFRLPFGIDKYEIVHTKRQERMEFGYISSGSGYFSRDEKKEKSMITGDKNAVLVEWVIQYKVSDPQKFLFAISKPNYTLRDASESVMREVVGDRTVDEVLTIGRQDIENQVQIKLKKLIDDYSLGISIDQVQLQNVNPPKSVQNSFDEVNQAQQEREKSIYNARGQANKIVPRAKGNADSQIAKAEGEALKRINEAEGDAQKFNLTLGEYVKAPYITRKRLYFETMSEILPKVKAKTIIDSDVNRILPLLNLNDTNIKK